MISRTSARYGNGGHSTRSTSSMNPMLSRSSLPSALASATEVFIFQLPATTARAMSLLSNPKPNPFALRLSKGRAV